MDDKYHKVQIQSCLLNMLQRIDSFTMLPSNKLLLYHRWVLSKLSWPLTVTNLSKIWVVENLDSVTTRFLNLHPVILLIHYGNLPVVEQTYNMIFIKILNRF